MTVLCSTLHPFGRSEFCNPMWHRGRLSDRSEMTVLCSTLHPFGHSEFCNPTRHRGRLSDRSEMTVLCSSISMSRVVHKDVESLKRALAANIVVHFYFVSPDKTVFSWLKLCS